MRPRDVEYARWWLRLFLWASLAAAFATWGPSLIWQALVWFFPVGV